MARDKGRRSGGRPPMRPTPTIDLQATEVTADAAPTEAHRRPDADAPAAEEAAAEFAASEADRQPKDPSIPPVPADEAATEFAASEADRRPKDPSVPPVPADEAATEFAASEADRQPDAFEGLGAAEGSTPRPADEPVPMQPTDCWPATPDEEADVAEPKPEPPHSAFPSESKSPAAASAIPGAARRAAPEPEAPSVDPQVFDRPRRGMGRDDLREPREKRGRGSILPGLFGGAAAGGLVAFGLLSSGIVPRPGPDAADEQRIAGIEASIRSLVESRAQPAPAQPATDPQLVERLAAAEAAIKALGESPAEPSIPADPALEERVTAADAAARQAGEQVTALGTEVRRLAEQVQSGTAAVGLPPPADTARLDTLAADIQSLRSEIGRVAETATAAPAGNAERLTALQQSQTVLDQRLAETDRRLAEIGRQAQDAAAATQQLGQRGEQLDRRLAEADQARQALGEQLASLAARENRPDADRQARLLLAVDALDAAIAAGRPYRPEIEAVKALAPDPAALAQLEDTADSGLPTAPVLAARAKAELAKFAPQPSSQPAPEGLLDRLASGARSLVKVTSPDDAPPPAAAAGDARGEFVARLAAGDLAGAGAAFARMDQAGQQAVADIELAAAARRAATGLLVGLRSGAIAALGNRS